MTPGHLFHGRLVKLAEENPETFAKAFNEWFRDTEMSRLLDSDPPRLWSEVKLKEWMEKDLAEPDSNEYFFSIRTLEEQHLIGFIGLFSRDWHHGDAWVGIGIGDREYWGRGYGTDAMQVIQRYAFETLNLRRLTLVVFEYNQRAIRSYQKAGFVVEGVARQSMLREGRRWDWIYMGILKEDWLKLRNEQ